MRSESRIPIVLDILKEAWLLAPDLRFNQLIAVVNKGEDCFYLEDEAFIEKIEKWIEDMHETVFPKEKREVLIQELKRRYEGVDFKIKQKNRDIFILHNNLKDSEEDFVDDIVRMVNEIDPNLVKYISVCLDISNDI